MYDKTLLGIFVVALSICGFCHCYLSVPVGVITGKDDLLSASVIRYVLQDRVGLQLSFEIIQENSTFDDPSQLARTVCRLLKREVSAIITPTNAVSYETLVSYSNKFQVSLLSPTFPEVPPDMRAENAIVVQPRTVRAILDLLRYYSWKNIVYLYDSDHGPEMIQMIYQLGYRVLKINLLGILKISHAEDANLYLRKLESTKTHRNFHVILDLDPELAKDVIVRHAHDVHVGKLNFHFLVTQPVLEDFWTSQTAEFRAVNVTGFVYTHPSWADFQSTWNHLPLESWPYAGQHLKISDYAFHDVAHVFSESMRIIFAHPLPFRRIRSFRRPYRRQNPYMENLSRDCLQGSTPPVPQIIVAAKRIKDGVLARSSEKNSDWSFDGNGNRKHFEIDIVESSRQGYKRIGIWSDEQGLKPLSGNSFQLPAVFLRRDAKRKLKIISIINPPFSMFLRLDGNDSRLGGNNMIHGYCKDLIDLLSQKLDFEYDVMVSNDSDYGDYDESKGEWSGMIREIIRGKADIAVADLQITGRRQKVVDFLEDPIDSVSLSLLMKNPRSAFPTSNMTFYFFRGLSQGVWICIIAAAILVIVCFHAMAKFTGSPDNIEATSGIWGKKFTFISSVWFIIGSSLMQDTGIYPRSLSCRILSGVWWCFTTAIFAMLVASITSNVFIDKMDTDHNPQLARLSSLSFESIITESIAKNWPQIGILRNGRPHEFIQKSNLPMHKAIASYLQGHSDAMVDSITEGIRKVRQSGGSYVFIVESSVSDYLSNGGQCDTVSIHDTLPYAMYGIAIPLGSLLKFDLNKAMRNIINRGELGRLRRKWWVDQSECKVESPTAIPNQNLKQMSGLFYLTLCGLFAVLFIVLAQYRWRVYKAAERRQRLSFEEVAMNQSLPLPPPELLSDSPMDEDSHAIDGWAERKLVPTSFSHESGRSVDEESGTRRN